MLRWPKDITLSKASLKRSSIFKKEYCVLWFLRNSFSTLDKKGSIYSLIWLKITLSKAFKIWVSKLIGR